MRGLTLIELMIALTVAGSIILIGIPVASSLLDRVYASIDSQELRRTLMNGRTYAITNSTFITVCPVHNGKCNGDWNNARAIFEDINRDGNLDENDHLITTIGGSSLRGKWLTRENNKGRITFYPEGFAFNSATTFLYCPKSGRVEFAEQLILNFQGRIKAKPYLNSRGSPYANLGQLNCQ